MPELPEVETMVRDLAPRIIGRRFTGVDPVYPGIIAWPAPEVFVHRVIEHLITGISRRGKYAILTLDSADMLVVHRGMTGSLLLRRCGVEMEPYVRLRLILDNGSELRLNDPRKFGKILLTDASGNDCPVPWRHMGPEPLDAGFTASVLQKQLQGRRGLIKPLLLNQRILAGLGNIYVDESLYRSGIHPRRRANTLTSAEIERLHGSILEVLGAAVEGRGTTFDSYTDFEGRAGSYQQELQVFRKTGMPCPRCATPVERLVVAGRGTHICVGCQKA